MLDMFSALTLHQLLLASLVTIGAGFVKGAVGFAMPLLMVSGLTIFLPPELSVALLLLPTVVTNLAQTLRFGRSTALAVIQEHWRYTLIVCIMIVIAAQLLTVIPTQALYLALGIPVTLLSLVQIMGLRLTVPPHRRRLAEWGIGSLAGVMGGLSGTWGPPTVLYLIALDTPKAQHLVVQGVIYSLGSVVLIAAHLRSGLLNAETAPLSALLLIPAGIGLWLGFLLSDRLDPVRFRQLTLAVLILAGLNLIRRGVFPA